MKTGTCSAVLGWPGDGLRHQDIRRLQVAAQQGGTLGLLFRSERAALEASPAPFRLVIRSCGSTPAGRTLGGSPPGVDTEASDPLQVKLLKRRSGWATDFIPVRTAASAHANPLPDALSSTDPDAQTLQSFQQQLSLWREQWRKEWKKEARRAQPLPADRHKPWPALELR